MPPKPQSVTAKAALAAAKAAEAAKKAKSKAKKTTNTVVDDEPTPEQASCYSFLQQFYTANNTIDPSRLTSLLSTGVHVQQLITGLMEPSLCLNFVQLLFRLLEMPEMRTISDPPLPHLLRLLSPEFLEALVSLIELNLDLKYEQSINEAISIVHILANCYREPKYLSQFHHILTTKLAHALFWWFKNAKSRDVQLSIIILLNSIDIVGHGQIKIFNPVPFLSHCDFFNYKIYGPFLRSVYQDPNLDPLNTVYALSGLGASFHRTPYHNMAEWIPLLLDVVERGNCIKTQSAAAFIISNLMEVMTKRDPDDLRWARAILGKDMGKRLFTLCCKPDPVLGSSTLPPIDFSPLQSLTNFKHLSRIVPNYNHYKMFNLMWECGLDKWFESMSNDPMTLLPNECAHSETGPSQQGSSSAAYILISLSLRFSPLHNFEKYPNFITNSIATACRTFSNGFDGSGDVFQAVVQFLDQDKNPRRSELIATSQIPTLMIKFIKDANKIFECSFLSLVKDANQSCQRVDFRAFNSFISYLHLTLYRCLVPGEFFDGEIPYNVLAMVVGWASDPAFISTVISTCTFISQVESLGSLLFMSFNRESSEFSQTVSKLKESIKMFMKLRDIVGDPDGEELDDVKLSKVPLIMKNALLNNLPQLKKDGMIQPRPMQGGEQDFQLLAQFIQSELDQSTSSPTENESTKTNNQTEPENTSTQQQSQRPISIQQQKVEARRAKAKLALDQKKQRNPNPDGMD